jgi:hypothetical protein
MNLAVVGSREFDNYELLSKELDYIRTKKDITMIVSGGAKGADLLARRYAEENGIELLVLEPDWERFGNIAGYLRNVEIWDNSDFGVAFWNGESKGTKHSFDIAKKQKKYCKICNF